MILRRHTLSLCSTCYKEIPAVVTISNGAVIMVKVCSEHGEQTGTVENDPVFYTWVRGLDCPSIYSGYFVDVTRTCNLRCTPCYFPLEKTDPAGMFTIERIVQECVVNAHLAPFILTGGEPTMRDDLPELIQSIQKIGPVELLTNGIRLSDPEVFNKVMPLITNKDTGIANLNLSIHHQETGAWMEVVKLCRADKIKIESCLIVIDSCEAFLAAIELAKSLSDIVVSFRIKAATNIWNEQKVVEHIFVSDMLRWLESEGKPLILVTQGRNTKSVFLNVVYDGMFLMLLSWHDITNVDLRDIDCPPYYRARNGEVKNFVTTGLINEGIAKGFLHGNRIPAFEPQLINTNGTTRNRLLNEHETVQSNA